jgi:hypothetical protein
MQEIFGTIQSWFVSIGNGCGPVSATQTLLTALPTITGTIIWRATLIGTGEGVQTPTSTVKQSNMLLGYSSTTGLVKHNWRNRSCKLHTHVGHVTYDYCCRSCCAAASAVEMA